MKLKKLPTTTWLFIIFNLYWTLIVILSCLILFSSSPDNIQGGGFLLMFAGLPSTILVALFDVSISVAQQILLMMFFGYIQFNLVAYALTFLIKFLDTKFPRREP